MTELPRPHVWRNGIHTGQGNQDYCERCGVRKGAPGSELQCPGRKNLPPPPRSEYDPLDFFR